MGSPLRVGVVGVGVISEQYFATAPGLSSIELVAVADLNEARAREVAETRGLRALTIDAIFDDPEIDIILNLTIPAAHAEVDIRALEAGKHVFGEKPLAVTVADGARILSAAATAGRRVGSAPDTVLGTGIQTARHTLDSDAIGTPVGAAVHWSAPGHERWHPAPRFYYQPGGGPLFDMGPYYLTSLVTLLGPVVRVSGHASRSDRRRVIDTGPDAGAVIDVDVDTHVSAILEHASGVASTVTVSFEVRATRAPLFEVFGTAGTLAVPDPNRFSDRGAVWTPDQPEWVELEPSAGYLDAGRGVGIADMALAITAGGAHRASGDLAQHVLEIMEAVLIASDERRVVELETRVDRPDTVSLGSRL